MVFIWPSIPTSFFLLAATVRSFDRPTARTTLNLISEFTKFYIKKTLKIDWASSNVQILLAMISVLFAVYKFPLCMYVCMYV